MHGGTWSEDTVEFLLLQNKYSKSLSRAENLSKLFTVLGEKFKFSAQDSDLEYLSWRSKNPPVSSDLKIPLVVVLPLNQRANILDAIGTQICQYYGKHSLY